MDHFLYISFFAIGIQNYFMILLVAFFSLLFAIVNYEMSSHFIVYWFHSDINILSSYIGNLDETKEKKSLQKILLQLLFLVIM